MLKNASFLSRSVLTSETLVRVLQEYVFDEGFEGKRENIFEKSLLEGFSTLSVGTKKIIILRSLFA